MSENFRKIKKKYMTVAIVAGAVLGACLGVALTCTLAVIFKTCAVNFHWALYIPIALVLSAGSGFLFFLILRPNDSRIAKKLDKEFALNQKVQTMVEYAGVEGALPELQREQTDNALGEVAKKRVNLWWLAKFAVVPVVAAAMLFAGIFVPARKSTGGPVDPGYDITDAHRTALKNLIADVEGSSLETGLKTFTVLELNGLLEMLQEAEYESAMKGAVITTVHNIDGLIAGTNSYLTIDSVLKADDVIQPFSTALVNAVVDYKGRNRASLTTMKVVREFEADADERILSVLENWKNKYMAEYAPKADGSETGTPLPKADAVEKLLTFTDALTVGLADAKLQQYAPVSGDARQTALAASAEGDALYVLLTNLNERLVNLASSSESGGYENDVSYYNAIDGYFKDFTSKATAALAVQSYNCMLDDYLRNSLSRIFGISRSEFGSNAHVAPLPTDDGNGGNNGNEEEANGGWSSGDHKYGSNDEVLDVDTNEAKKYGDYLNPDRPESGTLYDKYYTRAMEYIQSGSCPEEVAAYIRQYFIYLNSGLETDKTN